MQNYIRARMPSASGIEISGSPLTEREEEFNESFHTDSSMTNDIINFVCDYSLTDVEVFMQAISWQVIIIFSSSSTI